MKTQNSLLCVTCERFKFWSKQNQLWWITVSCVNKKTVCRRWWSFLLQRLIRFRHWAFWAWYDNSSYLCLIILQGPHFLVRIRTSLWVFCREINTVYWRNIDKVSTLYWQRATSERRSRCVVITVFLRVCWRLQWGSCLGASVNGRDYV
jgi:hypothetical protein